MDKIIFAKVGLVAILFAVLFIIAGMIGVIYDVYCGAIVFDRYYAVCFGAGSCCFAMAIICTILDLLFND